MFLFISINWRRIFLALSLAYRHIHEYVSNSHEHKNTQGHDILSQFKLIDVGYHTLKEREREREMCFVKFGVSGEDMRCSGIFSDGFWIFR